MKMKLDAGFWGNVYLLSPARLDSRRKSEKNCLTLPYLLIPLRSPRCIHMKLFLSTDLVAGCSLATASGIANFNELYNLRCLFELECACPQELVSPYLAGRLFLALKPHRTLHSTKLADLFMH